MKKIQGKDPLKEDKTERDKQWQLFHHYTWMQSYPLELGRIQILFG